MNETLLETRPEGATIPPNRPGNLVLVLERLGYGVAASVAVLWPELIPGMPVALGVALSAAGLTTAMLAFCIWGICRELRPAKRGRH